MASYIKRGKSWLAQVNKNGQRPSASFSTKAEAQAWATSIEAEIIAGKRGAVPNKTFAQLLMRYAEEVSPTKKGERWEVMRLEAICKDAIGSVKLADLSQPDIAAWRDRRLKSVSSATVLREWAILGSACTTALNEWKWLREHPMKGVKAPAASKPRDAIISDDDIEKLLVALGYNRIATPRTVGARVAASLLFAIETAMRAGEISGLTWDRVFIDRRFVTVREGKTDAAARDVPLTAEAIRILEQMPKDRPTVFDLSPTQIDANFRKGKKMAGVEGITYHDSRHTAITRLAQKLNILELARAVGHRDIRMLQVYFNASAEDMAGKL